MRLRLFLPGFLVSANVSGSRKLEDTVALREGLFVVFCSVLSRFAGILRVLTQFPTLAFPQVFP